MQQTQPLIIDEVGLQSKKGLGTILTCFLYIKAENDLERRDALLEEMRRLQQACPQDAVPEWLIATIASRETLLSRCT